MKKEKIQKVITEEDILKRIERFKTAKQNNQRIEGLVKSVDEEYNLCLLYTSPSPRD